MSTRISRDVTGDVLRRTQELVRTTVLVGIPESADARGDSGPGNAMLAAVHDGGSPVNNIPQRPFMEPGIASGRSRIEAQFRRAGELALQGKSPLPALNAVGLVAQSAIQQQITDGPFAPLKPGTLRARRRRGREGDRPLIDTGQLRRAITYVLRSRDADS